MIKKGLKTFCSIALSIGLILSSPVAAMNSFASEPVINIDAPTDEDIPMEETGWVYGEDGSAYYYDENGQIIFDQIYQIGDDCYYFDSMGRMYIGTFNLYDYELGDYAYYATNPDGTLMRNQWYVDEETGKKYYYGDDYLQYRNKICTIGDDGKTYYFDSIGILVEKDWANVIDGDNYGYNYETGEKVLLVEGWNTVGQSKFYVKDGVIIKDGEVNPVMIDDKYYSFDYLTGALFTGGSVGYTENGKYILYMYHDESDNSLYRNEWFEMDDGGRRYFGDDCVMYVSGIYAIDGVDYLFDDDGWVLINGMTRVEDKYYYADAEGSVEEVTVTGDGFIYVGGNYYYILSGDIVKGCIKEISGKKYGFDDNGRMYSNEVFDFYYFEDEIFYEYRYFAKESGELYCNTFFTVDDVTYYANEDCSLSREGLCEIDGKKYYFDYWGKLSKNKTLSYDGILYISDSNGVLTEVSFPLDDSYTKGKVNIFTWNNEIIEKINLLIETYPEYADKINVWNLDCSGTTYDYADFIMEQSENNYVSIFLMDESQVRSEYLDKSIFDPISELGITDEDYANSYDYTKAMGTVDDELKFLSWQACPNLFFYNTSIANEVFGTDDSDEIQKLIATPELFYHAAEDVKDAGYYMVLGEDSLQYILGAKNEKLGKQEGTDDFEDTIAKNGYSTGDAAWSEGWTTSIMSAVDLFGFFGTTWFAYDYMIPEGEYNVCEGPIKYYWGGTYLGVTGTGNDDEADKVAGFVLEKLCCDTEFMELLYSELGDYPNNSQAVNNLISDGYGAHKLLDNQNILEVFDKSAKNVYTMPEEEKLTGWQKIDNKWYYYDNEGNKVTGWKYVVNSWYYFDSTGVMKTGWQKIGSSWYYLGTDGAMDTGWVKIGTKWYYLNSNGQMLSGWKKIGGEWYYFATSGVMATGWQKLSGSWYYMNSNGIMQDGWLKLGKNWYYLGTTGVMATGWVKLGKSWYYMDASGVMATGTKKIGKVTYKFNSNGVWIQ